MGVQSSPVTDHLPVATCDGRSRDILAWDTTLEK